MTDEVKVATAAQAEGELAALKRRVEELEAAAKPKAPFVPLPHQHYDPTANATMSPTMMREMAAAVGDGLVRDVVGDFRAGPALPKSQAEPPKSVGSAGWAAARPLESPPGLALIDQQLDAAALADKVALARRLAGGGG